jgi:transposase
MLHSWSLDSMTEAMIGPAQELCGFFSPQSKQAVKTMVWTLKKLNMNHHFRKISCNKGIESMSA